MSAVRSQAVAISTGFGCTNTVLSAAATTSWWPFGTRASTLRAKWTRHRCEAEHLTVAASDDPGGDHDRPGDDLVQVCVAGLDVRRVEIDVRELDVRE